MPQDGAEHTRIVFSGPPGSGKTRRILERFQEARRERREERTLFIVPDASAREHMRDVLARLAPEDVPAVFSDAGIQTAPSIPRMLGVHADAGTGHLRALVESRFAAGESGDGQSGFLRTPGGRALLVRALETLRRYGYDSAKLRGFISIVRSESPVLIEAMESWDEWLNRSGKIDELRALKISATVATKRHFDEILIDGFTEILPPQWEVVKALTEQSDKAFAAIDPVAPPSNKLLEQFIELGFYVQELGLKENLRWQKGGILEWFGRVEKWNREAEPLRPPKVKAGREVSFVEAADLRTEAWAIAREVTRELGRGRSPGDIAIVVSHMREIRSRLESAFREAGIPIRFYSDRNILETSPGALMDKCLSLLTDEWQDDLVCSLLAHPGTGVPKEEARSVAVHTSRDASLRSIENWFDWKDLEKNPKAFTILNELRQLQNSSIGPDELADRIIGFVGEGLRSGWFDLNDDLVAEEGWAWDRVSSATREVGAILKEVRGGVSPAVAARSIKAELAGMEARPLDRRRDCVSAVTMLGSRTWSAPIVIIAGLAREYFPKRRQPNPFLTEKLCEGLNPQLPCQREVAEREEALFRTAVTRASERLILTRPVNDFSGSPLLPSPPLERCREWLGDIAEKNTVRISTDPPAKIADAVFVRDISALAFKNRIENPDLSTELGKHGVHRIPSPVANTDGEIVLKERARLMDAACGTTRSPISATHLNNLAQCKYRFFASRILRLRDPDRNRISNGLDYLTWGIVAHSALASWQKSGWTETVEKAVKDAEAEALRGIPRDCALEAGLKQMVGSLERFLQFENRYLKNLGFEPEYSELEFKPDAQKPDFKPIALKLSSGRTLRLGGRVDRVDVDSSGKAMIIDYKRSKSSASSLNSALKKGLDFQLACYTALVGEGLKLDVVLTFYVPLIDSGLDTVRVLADGSISGAVLATGLKVVDKKMGGPIEHLAESLKVISNLIEELGSGKIKPSPSDSKQCDNCPFLDLCRFQASVFDEGESEEVAE
jgi:RecB family exonuclease